MHAAITLHITRMLTLDGRYPLIFFFYLITALTRKLWPDFLGGLGKNTFRGRVQSID